MERRARGRRLTIFEPASAPDRATLWRDYHASLQTIAARHPRRDPRPDDLAWRQLAALLGGHARARSRSEDS
jgi:hypothetical protein